MPIWVGKIVAPGQKEWPCMQSSGAGLFYRSDVIEVSAGIQLQLSRSKCVAHCAVFGRMI